jgi:hypothetical protein
MAVWETDAALAERSDLMADFAAAWQAADKVVYSTTLAAVQTARTRLEDRFDPASVGDMKASATSDLTVGGAHLAAQAFRAGLVDECRLWVWPVILGGGKPGLPAGSRGDLELLDERRFGNGVMDLSVSERPDMSSAREHREPPPIDWANRMPTSTLHQVCRGPSRRPSRQNARTREARLRESRRLGLSLDGAADVLHHGIQQFSVSSPDERHRAARRGRRDSSGRGNLRAGATSDPFVRPRSRRARSTTADGRAGSRTGPS